MPINGVIGIICETKVKIDLQHVSQSRPTPEERKINGRTFTISGRNPRGADGQGDVLSLADLVRRVSPGKMSDVLHAAHREVAPIDCGLSMVWPT